MKLKIAQVIGLNTDQKAAQVTSSEREGNTFLAVLGLTSDDAFTKGRGILSELEDFYFESEGTPAEKLNAVYKEAETKLAADGWDLCLGAISGKVLYLLGKGGVEVYLKRGEKMSPLLSVGTDSQLVSGFLEVGDRLLFATKSLTAFLGQDLEKSISLPTETFEEEMGSRIGVSDLENQGLAALAIEATEESTEIPSLPDEQNLGISQETEQESFEEKPKVSKVVLINLLRQIKKFKVIFPKSGRSRLILAIILIVIIALGAGYKYKVSRDQKIQAEFMQNMQSAKDDFNTAKGLASLSPADAKTKLDSAKDKVSKALVLKPKDNEGLNFKKQIEDESAGILQQSSVSDFPVFLDMDLVKKNFRATQMSLSTGKLLLLDPAVKTLVAIDIAKKSNQILGGSENLGDAAFASLNGSSAFVYSKDKGILKVDLTNQKVTVVAKKDSGWGTISDIYGFAGNVYILDSGQIWKYLPAATAYSDKREYLTKGVKADFGNSLRMQIESSIYILKSGGEMLRFTKGDKDNFSYGGLPSNVKDPKSIFVSSDTDNLYLLDSGNSRLLILTKTGTYKGEIAGNKFGTATDLVVDEKGKKVYLLEGGKIYSVDLK